MLGARDYIIIRSAVRAAPVEGQFDLLGSKTPSRLHPGANAEEVDTYIDGAIADFAT